MAKEYLRTDEKRKYMAVSKKRKYKRRPRGTISKKSAEPPVVRKTSPEVISSAEFYFLKWIACFTMLLDHVGWWFQEQCNMSGDTYFTLRVVGRLAYPLFAYLLVESFYHTKNRAKHFRSIVLIAILSELQYDIMALNGEGKIINFNHQNICFELAAIWVCLSIIHAPLDLGKIYKNEKVNSLVTTSVKIVGVAAVCVISKLAHFEFNYAGIAIALLFAFARKNDGESKLKKPIQLAAILSFMFFERDLAYTIIIVDLAFIWFFDNKCYKNYKKKVYETRPTPIISRILTSPFSRISSKLFYPVHLLVLIAIRFIMIEMAR